MIQFCSVLSRVLFCVTGLLIFWCHCDAVVAQGFPTLNFQVRSLPRAYQIVVSTADGNPVKQDLELQAVVKLRTYQYGNVSEIKPFTINRGDVSTIVDISTPVGNQWSGEIFVETNTNEIFDAKDYFSTTLYSNYNFNVRQHMYVSYNFSSVPDKSNLTCQPGRRRGLNVPSSLAVKDTAKLPAFKMLEDYYINMGAFGSGTVAGNLSLLQITQDTHSPIHCSTTKDFPEDWKCLIGMSAIMISDADLKRLMKSKAKSESLKRWMAAGGQLVVFDAGDKFANRNRILADFGFKKPDAVEWQAASGSLKMMEGIAAAYNYGSQTEFKLPRQKKKTVSDFASEHVIVTDYLLGEILLTDSDMTSANADQWRILYNLLKSSPTIADEIGVANLNGQFNNQFYIPGLGGPPVLAFQILIGLFVLVIGPGLYIFLRITGRLHLLLVTVPSISLVSIIGLFAYGIISDGFGIRGRVQSVTFADERMGSAVTHGTYAYYSGLQPAVSEFDNDVLALSTISRRSMAARIRQLPQHQLVTGGHIRSRSQFQFTTYGISDDVPQLISLVKDSKGNPQRVANQSPDNIAYAVIHTAEGWYAADDIAAQNAGAAKKS